MTVNTAVAIRSQRAVTRMERLARRSGSSGRRRAPGGWRSSDRTALRSARDACDALRATPWADRARRELRASGEASRRRPSGAVERLTAQELEIARLAAAREVPNATATLVRSHFTDGFDALAAVKRRHGGSPWFKSIRGDYTGGILASSEADLRRIGRARFDKLEL